MSVPTAIRCRRTTANSWLSEPDVPRAVTRPHHDLGLAVLEQAVDDYRTLQRAGVVERDRVLVAKWPRKANTTYYCRVKGIPGPLQAKELIAFFMDGGWDNLCALLGVNLPATKVCRELGIID